MRYFFSSFLQVSFFHWFYPYFVIISMIDNHLKIFAGPDRWYHPNRLSPANWFKISSTAPLRPLHLVIVLNTTVLALLSPPHGAWRISSPTIQPRKYEAIDMFRRSLAPPKLPCRRLLPVPRWKRRLLNQSGHKDDVLSPGMLSPEVAIAAPLFPSLENAP